MTIGSFSYRQRDARIGIRSEVEAPFRHGSYHPSLHSLTKPPQCLHSKQLSPIFLFLDALHAGLALHIAVAIEALKMN